MHSEVAWIPRGSFQPLRYRPGNIGNWSGHLPFAGDLIAAMHPKLFVELGTHYGESYFGFCQAVAENDASCTCYAVDTWVGEEQSGRYDESVYQEVYAYNEAKYKSFSYLLRTTFDQAIDNFAADSIDMLHIDGLHTFEAVSHDFHNWLPKVRPGGVVLLHDVVARHADFGVWRLWEEMAGLGDRFLFPHSWGLGVFRKPDGSLATPDRLSSLFHADPQERDHIKKFYSLCALKLEHDYYRTYQAGSNGSQILGAQFFPRVADRYSPEVRYDAAFPSGGWQKICVELSNGLGEGPLRVDLAQQPCILDIAGITLRKAMRNEPLWAAVGSEIASLQIGGDMSLFEEPTGKDFCRFLSTGNDPQLYLALLSGDNLDQPLYLEVWIRAIVEPSSLLQILKLRCHDQGEEFDSKAPRKSEAVADPKPADPMPSIDPGLKALSECSAALQDLQAVHAQLLEQHETVTQEKTFLNQSYRKLQGDLYVAKSDLLSMRNDLVAAQNDLQAVKLDLETARVGLKAAKTDINASRIESQKKMEEASAQSAELVHARNVEAEKCRQLEKTMQAIFTSRSWRVTAPLRKFRSH